MATKLGNLCCPNGTYLKDGEEKVRWARCGVLLQKDNGDYAVKLDSVPVGLGAAEGWLQVFPDRDEKPAVNSGGGFRDAPQGDVPF